MTAQRLALGGKAQTRLAIPGGVEARIAATPLRKAGTGNEVAATVSFLLSDRASHLSGVVLPVDGGFTAWTAAGLPVLVGQDVPADCHISMMRGAGVP